MRVNSKGLAALLFLGVVFLSGCNLPVVQKLKARQNLNKGVTQYTNQKHDAAAQFFLKSLELDPEFDIARMYLATAYMSQYRRGSPDPENIKMGNRAIETFKEVVAKSEEKGEPNINAMLSIANLYYMMDQYSESREWCDRVLKIDPRNAEVYYRVAVMDYEAISAKTGQQGRDVKNLTKEEIAALRERVEEGLTYITKALEFRADYHDAMEYQNLLWREKAYLETNEEAKLELVRQADKVFEESLKLRRKAQEEAAKRPKTAAPK